MMCKLLCDWRKHDRNEIGLDEIKPVPLDFSLQTRFLWKQKYPPPIFPGCKLTEGPWITIVYFLPAFQEEWKEWEHSRPRDCKGDEAATMGTSHTLSPNVFTAFLHWCPPLTQIQQVQNKLILLLCQNRPYLDFSISTHEISHHFPSVQWMINNLESSFTHFLPFHGWLSYFLTELSPQLSVTSTDLGSLPMLENSLITDLAVNVNALPPAQEL